MKIVRNDGLIISGLILAALMLSQAGRGGALREPGPSVSPSVGPSARLTRIAFGSCADQERPQPIWRSILAANPQLFLFIGDNIYGDTEDMAEMRAKYQQLASIPGFARLRRQVPILAMWDDHDYGLNDGGADFAARVESQREFLDFWGVGAQSPRRKQDGVYDAHIFGPAGSRTQIILLDTRYHRSPLRRRPENSPGAGRYLPDDSPDKTMLGDEQWRWLEAQLRQPAEIRLVVSSIQVVPEDHGWEKWMNLPREREKLYSLIRTTGARGVIFLSGDRHLAELSMMDGGVGYPLYDLTASGLNNASPKWRPYEVNRHRVATMNEGDNFGLVTIDWRLTDPVVTLQVRDLAGEVTIRSKIRLSTLNRR